MEKSNFRKWSKKVPFEIWAMLISIGLAGIATALIKIIAALGTMGPQ